MKLKIVLIGFSILFFSSCGIQISKRSSISLENIFKMNSGIENLRFSGKVSASQGTQTFSANIITSIAKTDSVSMKIKLFGFDVGRLYSDPKMFRFFNIMENSVIEGEPSSENFYRATKIKVSFDDIVYMFKGLPPGGIVGFEFVDNDDLDDDMIMFKRIKSKEYIEYLIVSKSANTIRLYQRKDKDGELVLNTSYTEYEKVDGYDLAKKIKIKMNALDSEIKFDINDIIINEDFTSPFSFRIPKSAKRYNYFGN